MATYTLGEIIEQMEPQARLDRALIARCVEGLGLYAALVAADDRFSPKIGETRELAELLASYWGLDTGDNARSVDSYLFDFDATVDEAKSGGAVEENTSLFNFNVIFGLYRYGSDLLISQGVTAMGNILDVSERMKEIAAALDFEPGVLNDLTGRLETEVRDMLEKTPMPGQPVSGEDVNGYSVLQSVLFDNDRGFALAHSPAAPDSYATWQFTEDNGERNYYWGHYIGDEEGARIDYITRAIDYKETYRVQEVPPATAFIEAGAEQNYNMIDGARNNEGVPKPDLTDGQTHAEVRELAPETLPGYPAVTALADKLTGIVDSIAARTEQSFTVDILEIYEDTGVDLMQNSALRSAVLDALRAVPEIADFVLDKNELTVYRGTEDIDIGSGKFEAFIRNGEDANRGEWLTLPAGADTLRGLFDRIGVEGTGDFDMPVINTPMPHLLRRHVAGCENLDELNMLADYMDGMADFELDKLRAVLTYKPEDAGYGAAALINLICHDNFDAFELIAADNAEELGRYYARENDEVPDGVSFEDYGSQVSAEEQGDFTPWGYLKFKYTELLPEYTGKVPDEYKIVGAALGGTPVKASDRLPEEKPSVLKRIRDAEKITKPPRKGKAKDRKKEGER